VIARPEAPRLPRLRLGEPKWVAIGGIVLGALAFWLALPPVTARAVFWPIALGILAVAAGIWAVTRGARKVGWGAIASGLLGIGLGYLATRSSVGHLEGAVTWGSLLAAMLRYATPLTFAAIGGMFSERSGVVNIGLEGMMLIGAFFAIVGADKSGSWVVGILAAMVAGAVLAFIHAVVSIQLRADQIVSGVAVNFLALGVTGYFFVQIYKDQGTPGDIPRIPEIGGLNLMIWVAFALVALSYVVMFKTPIGLRLRAVGEHPKAADTVGISVYKTRYAAVTFSGVLAALGGAYLSIGFLGSFNEGMTAGRGFIALAALIIGNWRPFGALGAALLFGFSGAVARQLSVYSETLPGIEVIFQALPYVLTLIVVAGIIGRTRPPAAISKPYVKQ
jgi:simple sugar transport system permease protein